MWIALFFYLYLEFLSWWSSLCLFQAKDLYLGSHFRIPFTWASWILGIRSKFQINLCVFYAIIPVLMYVFVCEFFFMSLDLCLMKCQNQLVFFFFLIIPLVLSCLDQLRFIECYKQIIVHCADYLFFYWVSVFKGSFFYLCQSSAWLVRKCWARDFLFHHSIEPKSVIGLVTSINLLLFFFFSP